MRIEQLTYLSEKQLKEIEKRAHDWDGHNEWYYVCSRDNENRVLYADEKGRLYYGDKEFSRVIPVVWNNRSECFRVAKWHKGKVKKYPYLLR